MIVYAEGVYDKKLGVKVNKINHNYLHILLNVINHNWLFANRYSSVIARCETVALFSLPQAV